MKIKKSKTSAKKSERRNSTKTTEKPPSTNARLNSFKSISDKTLGTILIGITCILFWFPYPYTEKTFIFTKVKHLSLYPSLLTGFCSLSFTGLLYIRGIFSIKKHKFALLSFLLNLTLFATIFEIFISPEKEAALVSPIKAAFVSFSLATILFGVRETAKTVFILLIAGTMFFRLKLVSDAMGIFGYIAFLTMISGLYFEESICPELIKKEWQYLLKRPDKEKSKSELE